MENEFVIELKNGVVARDGSGYLYRGGKETMEEFAAMFDGKIRERKPEDIDLVRTLSHDDFQPGIQTNIFESMQPILKDALDRQYPVETKEKWVRDAALKIWLSEVTACLSNVIETRTEQAIHVAEMLYGKEN